MPLGAVNTDIDPSSWRCLSTGADLQALLADLNGSRRCIGLRRQYAGLIGSALAAQGGSAAAATAAAAPIEEAARWSNSFHAAGHHPDGNVRFAAVGCGGLVSKLAPGAPCCNQCRQVNRQLSPIHSRFSRAANSRPTDALASSEGVPFVGSGCQIDSRSARSSAARAAEAEQQQHQQARDDAVVEHQARMVQLTHEQHEQYAATLPSLLSDPNFTPLQRCLFADQQRFSALRDKRGMRWHAPVLRFAIALRARTGEHLNACYLCSGIANTRRVLQCKHTHTCPRA